MSFKVKKIDLIITIMLLLPDQFCFLINKGFFKEIFKINYNDFVLIIYLLFFIYTFLFCPKYLMLKSYHFKWLFIWTIPMSIIAAYIPCQMFGQNFMKGFLVQRTFFIIPLMYLSYRTLINQNIITIDRLLKIVFGIGVVTTTLCVIQYFLYNFGIVFLDVTYRQRLGLRIRSNFAYPVIVILISLDTLMNNPIIKKKQRAMIALLISSFFEIFVMQTRMEIMGVSVAVIVMIMCHREAVSKKFLWSTYIVLVAIILLNTKYGQLLQEAFTSVSEGTDLRSLGREYYLQKLRLNWVWGYGYPHESSVLAETAAGYYIYNSWGYILNDNGIFGFAYIYGLAGVIWFFALCIKLLKSSLAILKRKIYLFLPYTTYLLAIMLSLLYWYWNLSAAVMLVIVVSMLEHYRYDIKIVL